MALEPNGQRYQISVGNQLTSKREIKDVRKVFVKAKSIARGKPDYVVTDGLKAYQDAFKKEFFTLKGPRIKHVRPAGIAKRKNNNVVESFSRKL